MLRAFLACLIVALTVHSAAAGDIQFSRDILPILSDACFQCHGPDDKAREGDLRLDREADVFRDRDSVHIIVRGKADQSELVRRILSTNPDEVMPPARAAGKLTKSQIALLKKWVDEGAPWGQHWAFEPMARPEPPVVQRTDWPTNAIDRFILARLEREGLSPAAPANRETLIRRVTFDLTGLPPTPAEVAAFVADPSPEAYERVVDRLLESPRYGERMAADWLDIARYADTHGYQMDRYRAMWPYRDWVIGAFNRNLPFDEFIVWQLAGDLLPDATREQRLATAFNRLHMQNEEGGVVAEEFRTAYVVDRVNTMGTAFLGLTFECSRCHNHKYDPISQQEFYGLYSFFNNIDEYGQTTYFTPAMPVPTLLLPDDATEARLAEFAQQIPAAEHKLQAVYVGQTEAFATWLGTRAGELPLPRPVAAFDFETLEGSKAVNSIDAEKPLSASDNPQLAPGKVGQAVVLSGDNSLTGGGVGAFARADAFSFTLWLKPAEIAPREVVFHASKAAADAGSRGYELLLENGYVSFGLHHMWPGNSLKVTTKAAIPAADWTHVAISYDGSSKAAGLKLFLNGNPADVEVIRDGLFKDITYDGASAAFQIGARFRDSGFKGGSVDELQIYNLPLTAIEVARIAGNPRGQEAWSAASDALTPGQREELQDYYLARFSVPVAEARKVLAELRQEQSKSINPVMEVMAMREMSEPRPTFVLKRGAYDAPGEPVTAGTPAVLPAFPADQPKNRLGLARWLTDAEHPLTARVTVNRAWQQCFGRGLVETTDNFGSQGAWPSHPDLLDGLARDFVASGWDMKALLKQIVMSATYRQSSVASTELLARDPANVLHARGPVRRLTAEMLRDQALAVSGLFAEKLGGPSVKPYQPDGLWDVAMGRPQYDQGHGPDLYRRSLYTFWKRTVPPPSMITFDAADRNVCVVKRQSTSTPLQALALLNDVQIVEAARFLGQRMLKEGGSTLDDRLAWAFRSATSRSPQPRQIAVLKQVWDEQRAIFAADPVAAQKLLAQGEGKADDALDPLDLAAATVVAELLLNFDETVVLR